MMLHSSSQNSSSPSHVQKTSELDQHEKINAMIAYFFLGWIFLLARENPNFSTPFVQHHSWKATFLHISFFILYGILWFVSGWLYMIPLPAVIPFKIPYILYLFLSGILVLLILKNAQSASQGKKISKNIGLSFLHQQKTQNMSAAHLQEGQKVIGLLSFVPLVSFFIVLRHPNKLTYAGSKISGLFSFLLIGYYAFNGYDIAVMILLAVYIFYFVFIGVSLFIKNEFVYYEILSKIPSGESIHIGFLSLPGYISGMVYYTMHKKEYQEFGYYFKKTKNQLKKIDDYLQKHYTDKKLLFSLFLIYIPFINLIFIFSFFAQRNSRYRLAFAQGFIITFLICIFGVFYSFSSTLLVLFLLPICLGLSYIELNPFYRVPVIYEIYSFVHMLVFGMRQGVQKLKKKNQESHSFVGSLNQDSQSSTKNNISSSHEFLKKDAGNFTNVRKQNK